MILESAESKCIALGVVFEDVGTQLSLGKEGTVGYHTKYARIHDSSSESGNITIGMYMYVDRASQMCLYYATRTTHCSRATLLILRIGMNIFSFKCNL